MFYLATSMGCRWRSNDSLKNQLHRSSFSASIPIPSNLKRNFSDPAPNCGFDRPKDFNLSGTVHYHKRHAFFCSGQSAWPSNLLTVEPYKAFQTSLSKLSNTGMKYSATDEPSNDVSAPDLDLLVFPEKVRISKINFQHFDKITEWLSGNVLDPHLPRNLGLDVEYFHSTYVFICAHSSKDPRCGYCGPILVEMLTAELLKLNPKADIKVRKVSHIGGHAYAGNVIIFGRESTGDYLGNIGPGEVEPISKALVLDWEKSNHNFHSIIGDFKLWKYWRGKLGWTQDEQKNYISEIKKTML